VHNYTDAMHIFMVNVYYFATHSGKYRDPNLGPDPVFAEHWT